MSSYSTELLYSQSHEWVRIDQQNKTSSEITVGITEYAQKLLGEVVFVELPELHRTANIGDEVAVLESVKTAADVYCPVQGEIIAINTALQNNPSQINQDPYGHGWLFKVRVSDSNQLTHLLDEQSYTAMIDCAISNG